MSSDSTNYDLLIVTDATASMGSYLEALRSSIPEILALSRLSGVFSRLAVLAYKDYSDPEPEIVAWSGWNSPNLLSFVQNIVPSGGGDYPEAAKSALIKVLAEVDDKHSETLVLWYTDAPPHHASIRSYGNDIREKRIFPAGATDWVKLCFSAREKRCTVFAFTPDMNDNDSSFYVLLSQTTRGVYIAQDNGSRTSTHISRLTLDVILTWMGQGVPVELDAGTTCRRFDVSAVKADPQPTDEDQNSHGYLPSALGKPVVPLVRMKTAKFKPEYLPRGSITVAHANLAKRFADPGEAHYRETVYESLMDIIEVNVYALTYNPVFGQLWRAVCKEQENPQKNALLNAFSMRVGQVKDPLLKEGLQKWLDDSFDATEEIEAIIKKVGTGGQVVYLDLDADVELTRTELLEVSKSCYSGVLKKVASIFTHLKLAEPDMILAPQQRSIPLNLKPRDFFRLLPHLVVPGTLYPARAASITAILALVTGVPFLRSTATTVLETTKGTWLNLEIPENISFDCARLLLSAPEGTVLTEQEKQTYEDLRRYRYIELNLDSTIEVQVPWVPQKTRGVGDRLVECRICHCSRSVTLMSDEKPHWCGLCVSKMEINPEHLGERQEIDSCWVECSEKTCRAQYVVENPRDLRIRPKCHYCRHDMQCPWLECMRCTNRVIVPKSYRTPKDKQYICPACEHPEHKITTVVPVETTTRALKNENGVQWLGLKANPDIFEGKSAFKMMQAHGLGVFDFVAPKKPLELRRNGKTVHEAEKVLAQVERRVGSGEVELGSCTLCFEEMSRTKLVPACGRSGCSQMVDEDCLRTWYSASKPGRLLNVMQLCCPFCRRKPTVKTLTRYNPPAAALGGLQNALNDRGFFYAWCIACGFAKQAQERACCDGDRVPAIENFECAECSYVPPPAPAAVRRTPVAPRGPLRVMPCPRCGVMIEKTDGCNHISCQCGAHFCFVCGEKQTEFTIYKHMSAEHGGAFDDEYD